MDWSTVAVELIERILIFTESLYAVANAFKTCKAWNGVAADSHFWKGLYSTLSSVKSETGEVDWKAKVMDLVLVRSNIKNGRCVVRTLAATERVHYRVSLGFDNISVYKDMCLVNWMETEDYGSYGGVSRSGSDFINMVTGKIEKLRSLEEAVFLNHYIANTPSGYYGRADFVSIKVMHFDQEELDSHVFDDNNGLKLQLPQARREPIKNYCPDSNYIGFLDEFNTTETSTCRVVNGETGEVVFQLTVERGVFLIHFRMYDQYLAVTLPNNDLFLINTVTKKETVRHFKTRPVLGFMTHNEIALRTDDQVILWNYINDTDVSYPAADMPLRSIEMVYHNMWVVTLDANIMFYNVKDGSPVNTLVLRQGNILNISPLSDGRLAVLQYNGCRVISFVDSEGNRKVKILLLNHHGEAQEHEISAFELCNFFRSHIHELNHMNSRVINYSERELQPKERFVMIFSQSINGVLNEPATKLFKNASAPTCVKTPYQGWMFNTARVAISTEEPEITHVYGKVLIVREKKIDGRWQLVSM